MAEIEHFVHPKKKDHPKFASVAGLEVTLYPAPPRDNPLQERQMIRKTIGAAVREVRPTFHQRVLLLLPLLRLPLSVSLWVRHCVGWQVADCSCMVLLCVCMVLVVAGGHQQ
jgi:hypothetical protein